MHVILNRNTQSDKGTFGVLIMQNAPLCVTLELPWVDNKRDISCIPCGVYGCAKYTSERYGQVWKIHDVPNRSGILFHAGNTLENTSGCVLVGQSFGKDRIDNSRLALEYLRETLPESFALSVIGGSYDESKAAEK